MRKRNAGERSARPRPPAAVSLHSPLVPLTANPLSREEALCFLQEPTGLFDLVGLDGGHRDSDTALRLIPVGFHGGRGGGRRRRTMIPSQDDCVVAPTGISLIVRVTAVTELFGLGASLLSYCLE